MLLLYFGENEMKTNVCLVDLDDTLGDLKQPMMEALNAFTGKNIHWSQWNTFDVPQLYGLSNEEFLKMCIDSDILNKVIIHDSSYKFLNDLRKLGYYTVLITARGWHPEGKSITESWVSEHNLDIDELIVVGVDQSKTDVITKFDNIVFSIDDRIKHCREYMQSGMIRHVLVYNAPWNEHMTKLNPFWGGNDYHERIIDLHEIIDHVEWCDNNRRITNVC